MLDGGPLREETLSFGRRDRLLMLRGRSRVDVGGTPIALDLRSLARRRSLDVELPLRHLLYDSNPDERVRHCKDRCLPATLIIYFDSIHRSGRDRQDIRDADRPVLLTTIEDQTLRCQRQAPGIDLFPPLSRLGYTSTEENLADPRTATAIHSEGARLIEG